MPHLYQYSVAFDESVMMPDQWIFKLQLCLNYISQVELNNQEFSDIQIK